MEIVSRLAKLEAIAVAANDYHDGLTLQISFNETAQELFCAKRKRITALLGNYYRNDPDDENLSSFLTPINQKILKLESLKKWEERNK